MENLVFMNGIHLQILSKVIFQILVWKFYYLILYEEYFDFFPNIIKLISIAYTIPVSSVECEHGFSKQNLIKTKCRNLLTASSLDLCMRKPRLQGFWFLKGLVNLEEWKEERFRENFYLNLYIYIYM